MINDSSNIFAKLVSIKGERIATGQSFNKETGDLSAKNTVIINEEDTKDLVDSLKSKDWKITDIQTTPKKQNPYRVLTNLSILIHFNELF